MKPFREKPARPFVAHRVDKNQPDIVAALRRVGASVCHLHMVGDGCPDLLVGFRGVNFIIEEKTANGRLRDSQREFAAAWRGRKVDVVRNGVEACVVIGALPADSLAARPAEFAPQPSGKGKKNGRRAQKKAFGAALRSASVPGRPVEAGENCPAGGREKS